MSLSWVTFVHRFDCIVGNAHSNIEVCQCLVVGMNVVEWFGFLISNHLPLTFVGLNFVKDFEFFLVRKLKLKMNGLTVRLLVNSI